MVKNDKLRQAWNFIGRTGTNMPQSDRKVLIALCAIIVIAIGVAFLFSGNFRISFSKSGDFDVASQSEFPKYPPKKYSQSGKSDHPDTDYYGDIEPQHLRLVTFDPNTADAATLEGLGLARWQVKSILNFRAKGGEFRSPEDFARVYKLTANQYKRLRPYIRISAEYQSASRLLTGNENVIESEEDSYRQYAKIGKGEYITLNQADTTMLRRVPGIGAYFARQIVNYEKRLGGYVEIDQLSEIDNFPEDAKQYFQIDLGKVKKLNINKFSLAKLRAHPYINYYQARDIVEYRHKYGDIKSIEELKLSPYFTESDIKRIKPYIEY